MDTNKHESDICVAFVAKHERQYTLTRGELRNCGFPSRVQ
jgi:hypothetical protein